MKSDKLENYIEILNKHDKLRKEGINLLASENKLSSMVRNTLSGDLAGRYSSEFYGGSKYNRLIIRETEELAKELFECDFASVIPVSGHLCDLAALNSLTSEKDKVAIVGTENGGYPFNVKAFQREKIELPFNAREWNLDYSKLDEFYNKNEIKLTILGSSVIPYKYNISSLISSVDNSHPIIFDASHVLGLIAGGKFQNPFNEGINTIIGSTHKSFPGPQGGLILSNDRDEFYKIVKQFSIQEKKDPFSGGTILVDNVHSNRIAALGIAMLEMLEFGEQYASQIVKNSKSLGKQLTLHDLVVFRNSDNNYSDSHQIILPKNMNKIKNIKDKLEKYQLFVDDFVRIGTSEITRMGYKGDDIKYLGELINRVLIEESSEINSKLLDEILELSRQHQKCHYVFQK